MFELTKAEMENWRYQFGTSNKVKMGMRVQPFVFTEHGVAMLSSVLRSRKAVEVNISLIRAFVAMREEFLSDRDLRRKVLELEENTDRLFQIVFKKLEFVENMIPLLPKERNKIKLK